MNLSPRKNLILALLAASVVGIVLAFVLCRPAKPVDEKTDARPAAKARVKAEKPKIVRKHEEVAAESKADDRSPDERLSDALADALQKEDFDVARKLAAEALLSTNADVRVDAVGVLGWFGEKAIPELTAFVSDGDETVRREAMGHWKNAVSGLEDEKQKARIVGLTMKVLKDPEAIEDVAGELPNMSERSALRILNEMISSGNAALAAQGRETYKFITGEDYTTKADADAWLKEAEDVD